MKIDKVSETDYKIYMYNFNIDEKNINEEIKLIVKKLQKRLKLKGFYKVISAIKKCGLFLEVKKIEDSFYRDTLDLRIIVSKDMDVYFKTIDYFLIEKMNVIKYFDKYYYALVDDFFDEIIEKVEFGDFVFGLDIDEMLSSSVVIQCKWVIL